jgi:hypothetical protein
MNIRLDFNTFTGFTYCTCDKETEISLQLLQQ